MLNSRGLIQEPAGDGSPKTTSRPQTRSASSSARSCGVSTKEIKLYFFGLPDRIKIGISKNVAVRLQTIGRQLLEEPVLLGAVAGSFGFEKHLHQMLAAHRLRGEWFRDCQEVRHVMDRVLCGEMLGFYPKSGSAGNVEMISREKTAEEWLEMFNRLVVMVYPGDPVGGLADDLEVPVDDIRKYLTGVEPVPRVIAAAFASRLMIWIGS